MLPSTCMNNDNRKVETMEIVNAVDINQEPDNEEIPLITACKNKDTEIVKVLIDYGVDINIKNKNNETPLTIACDNGSQSIIKLLVEHGADTNRMGLNGSSPLTIACKNENEWLIQYLIKYGADINMKDKNNYTPLAVACTSENDSIIKLLIDSNVYLNIRGIDHPMPLPILYRKNNSSLLKNYFNPNQAIIINNFLINHFCTLYINQFKMKGCLTKIFIKSLNKDIYGVLSVNHSIPLNYFNINDTTNTSYKITVKWFEKTYSIRDTNFIFTSELLDVIFIELNGKIVGEVQPYFLSLSNNENEIRDVIYSLQFSMNRAIQRHHLNEAIVTLLNKYKYKQPMSFGSLFHYLNVNFYEKIYLDHYRLTKEKINSKFGFNFVFYSDCQDSQTTATSNNTCNDQMIPIFNENLNVMGMYSFSREDKNENKNKNKKRENRVLESKIIAIAINNLYNLNNSIKARHPAKPLSDQEIRELSHHGLQATTYSPYIFISPPSEFVTALLFYRTNHSWYWTPTIPKEYSLTEIKNLNWSIISEGEPIKAIGGRWNDMAPASRNVTLIEWLLSTKLQYLQ
ncbi:ankyrin repeat-containing domain protein [Neocallimastix sp. 'constans']